MSNTQVVITRKDKRLRKGLHLLAFMVTGGASAPVTVARASANGAYNARTHRLATGQSGRGRWRPAVSVELTDDERAYMAAHVPASARRGR